MDGGSELVDILGRLALFADFTRPELEAVAHTVDEEMFSEGQRVLRQGLSGSGFFVILEGQAAISTLLRCVVVPGPEFEQFLLARPRLMYRLLQAEAHRLRTAIEWRS